MLTTGVDNIVGTAANDTINAYINTTTATVGQTTLTGADVVGGGAGIDTMNLSVEGANGTGTLTAAAISGIERFFIRDLNSIGASTYNFAVVAGETEVWNDRSTQNVTFDNLAAGTTLGIKGDGSNNVGTTTFKMAAATDAVTIAIDGGVRVADPAVANIVRNATGAAAVTINSTGAANTVGKIDLDTGTTITAVTINAATNLTARLDGADFAAASTLTLKGAGAIDLSGAALAANITTVNAADNAGGVNLIVGVNTATVTGGAGNDTINAGTLVFNVAGTLNAGAGTDTLVLADAAQLTAATAAKISNFEILRLNDDSDGALDTFNAALLTGLTGVVIGAQSTGNGVTVNGLTAALAGNVTIAGTQTVGPTFGVTGATTVGQLDTLALKIDDGLAEVNVLTAANLTAAGVETVRITATDGLTLTTIDGLAALTRFEVTGAGAVTVSAVATTLNVNTVVDASAATGAFTFNASAATGGTNGLAITGSATKANTLTGSGHADVITGGAGNDALVGGAGNDVINGGAGNDTITGGAGADVIDVGAGTDRIIMSAVNQSFAGASIVSGTTVLTGIDRVTGMAAGDVIDLSGIAAGFTGAAVTTIAAATGTNVGLVRGNFVEGTGIFTADAAGTSTLVVYDADAGGAGTAVEAIVLVGVAGLSGTAATGVLTLA